MATIRVRCDQQIWTSDDDGETWRRLDGTETTDAERVDIAKVFAEAHPAFRAAVRRGHDLRSDPPANELSNTNRFTCSACRCAVLWTATTHFWGSALGQDCVLRALDAVVDVELARAPAAPRRRL